MIFGITFVLAFATLWLIGWNTDDDDDDDDDTPSGE